MLCDSDAFSSIFCFFIIYAAFHELYMLDMDYISDPSPDPESWMFQVVLLTADLRAVLVAGIPVTEVAARENHLFKYV